jgi:midasin (ATPase involved in ribosome maturation)
MKRNCDHMTKSLAKRKAFIDAVKQYFGTLPKTLVRSEIMAVCEKYDLNFPQWLTADPQYRAGRGEYKLPVLAEDSAKPSKVVKKKISKQESAAEIQSVVPVTESVDTSFGMIATTEKHPGVSLVPPKATGYVPFGHFNDVREIVSSRRFYPMYITGLSGNGKTMMVEQVCAQEKRECIRVNITRQTDEDDLLGGMRLINGQTVWQNGPVIHAMERGAILLLDEVDLGDEKMMCLQPVLEGKQVFLKKINRVVTPTPGFNIIATANTKGKGSDDGRFIGTNVMNEAFLERFSVTLEQEYPALKVEARILKNVLKSSQIEDNDFVEKLVNWADLIRKAFAEGAVSDLISTRRLVHICEAYAIFNRNREKAIQLCLNRFDIDTKSSFMSFYEKLDESVKPLPTEIKEASTIEVTF